VVGYQPQGMLGEMGFNMICQKQTGYNVQTVEKAIELLEVIAESKLNPTLPELSSRVGLSRNKTFRLLATLSDKGLVDQEKKGGGYQLGFSSLELAQKLLKNSNIVHFAHPVMEELVRKHAEAVYLTVLKGEEVLFLDMVDCDQQIKAASLVGKRFPFFTNAAGKILKALESRDLLEKVFKKRGGRDDMPDLESLSSELNDIRTKGVAVETGGLGEGVISVAVAVRDYAGKVIGAITLLGPSFRLIAERLEDEIIPSLMEGAEILSEKFGYAPV